MTSLRIPLSTYRLQFGPQFRFRDARRIVSYLRDLGISHLYASPIYKARPDSPHGYDVTDHQKLNPRLGSESEFRRLAAALRAQDMGLLFDVVPNHMNVSHDSNAYWQDVLENGPGSPFARFFDIDWNPHKTDLENKVLLPILGDQYGRVLESGELRLGWQAAGFSIVLYDRHLPLAPRTWVHVLQPVLERLAATTSQDDPHLIELESILRSLRHLPPRTATVPEKVTERRREKEAVRRRLGSLLSASASVRRALDSVIAEINGRLGDPASFAALEALLAEQCYRLSYWRVASDEINYRRFFDINDLAAIRVEQPDVFEFTHALVHRLVEEGLVSGLRIDHPDGLFDPEAYLRNVQERTRSAIQRQFGETECCGSGARPCFIVAEKILVGDERLRSNWAVHGTTGYDFLNDVNGLWIDTSAERAIRELYGRFAGKVPAWPDLVYDCKRLVLELSMSSELHMLARRLDRISEQHRWSRDFTLFTLQAALREIIACFPVYRNYIQMDADQVSPEGRLNIERAVHEAKRRNPVMSESLFDFIASVLLLQDPDGLGDEQRTERRDFVLRFQQLTAPVMAKGLEDTAFYRSYALASQNEVGGDPARFGCSVDEFHRRNVDRFSQWPHGLCATSTHDTKRSEDIRARLDVLSEVPDLWEESLRRWHGWNRSKKSLVDSALAPDTNEEYLIYQTIAGAWPMEPMKERDRAGFAARIQAYIHKALREAKLHTSWVSPNLEYESAVESFVRALLAPGESRFQEDLLHFLPRVTRAGALNSLAQVVLKVVSPGTPDFYQGTELWDLSLADPDNRRAVDLRRRAALLQSLQRQTAADRETLCADLLREWRDGRVKLYVTWRSLQVRGNLPDVFLHGAYTAVESSGPFAEHVVACARQYAGEWVLAVVPRLCFRLAEGTMPLGAAVWGDTGLRLPAGAPAVWRDAFTGRALQTNSPGTGLPLADVFATFPVALLHTGGDEMRGRPA